MADQADAQIDQTEQQNGEELTEATGEQPMESQETGGGDSQQAASEEDEDDRKLFVGNLSWETTQKDLKDYFSRFGEVTSCTLKTEMETKKSRGFGFVVFKDGDKIEEVLNEKDHKLNGRTIDPKRANPRREVCKKIFVGKCDPSTPESDIKEYFSKFGKIEKVELPFDKTKDQRRGFVFVEFSEEEAFKKCLEETSHKLGTQEFDVKKATPTNQAKRGGRGGYGWGPDRGRGGRGGYNQNYYPGYQNYGGYGGYGGYDSYNYGSGYGSGYGGYGGGWGGYDQGYYQYPGGYDYQGWGYDQGQQNNSSYGKSQKGGRGGGGYHPYNR